MGQIKFGVFLPFYAFKYETKPNRLFNTVRDVATKCERLGFSSIWLDDHLMYGLTPLLECWSTLSALSANTSRIRLGTMVTSGAFRNPALLAKTACTVDAISNGRLEFGIGAGVQKEEHEAYGIAFPNPADRISRLNEAVEVIKAMWTQQKVTYNGKYFQVNSATCEPKPIQKPHPPVIIGGCGEKLTLRTTARYANRFDFGYLNTVEEYTHKLNVLKDHCRVIGRNFDEIEKSAWPSGQVLLSENEIKLEEKIRQAKPKGMRDHDFKKSTFAGSFEEFSKLLKPYIGLGVEQFMLFFGDLPRTDSIEEFAEGMKSL